MIHRRELLLGLAALPLLPVLGGCRWQGQRRSVDASISHWTSLPVRHDGREQRVQVFVPGRAGVASHPPRGLPVILSLHGSGERGGDGQRPAQVGLGRHLRQSGHDFPAMVLFPQAPVGSEWTDTAAPLALATLDTAIERFGCDPRRVYLTGMSMGGFGTWEVALRQPHRFAALVPVCGGITVDWTDQRPGMNVHSVAGAPDPFAAAAARLRDVPAWIFHGARDDVVPPSQSRRMAAALRAAGAGDVHYTEFPEANHNSWDAAYAHAPMWDWLFSRHLT